MESLATTVTVAGGNRAAHRRAVVGGRVDVRRHRRDGDRRFRGGLGLFALLPIVSVAVAV